jgi:hypothetical protein
VEVSSGPLRVVRLLYFPAVPLPLKGGFVVAGRGEGIGMDEDTIAGI